MKKVARMGGEEEVLELELHLDFDGAELGLETRDARFDCRHRCHAARTRMGQVGISSFVRGSATMQSC